MLMKVEPLKQAIAAAKAKNGSSSKVIYLSPQGQTLTQEKAQQLASEDSLIFISGRYEGIDERLIQTQVDEEISIGDYVLSGGELAAMVVMDSIIRLVPEVLGHDQSAVEDSFVDGLLDCPHYTRPENIDGLDVPEVLLSGNHEKIKRWRLKQALGRTWQRRPDLMEKRELNKLEQSLLQEFIREVQGHGDT
jgi:tRNA (guanine37-N1)-methyltransferase